MKRLEEKIKQYDVEIEQLCNSNYKSFVETFNELLLVREDTAELKNNLVENNNRIQKVGKTLISKVEELTLETKKQTNILLSIEALNKYMPVFHIYRQLKEQMSKNSYYPALKLLEELENNYLPIVKHYRFSKSIHQSIPLFKEEIKTHTITELKTFLENVRIQSEQCGRIANQQMAKKLKIDRNYYLMDRDLSRKDLDQNEDSNMKKLPFDVIDFSPLYKNLHMNQVLGSKAFFADYYRNQRRKQLQLHLQPYTSMETGDINSSSSHGEQSCLDGYKKYFHTMTGFFVIEDQILSSTEGLVDERYLDELFGMAVPRLITVIRKVMEQSRDAELMLKIKIIVVLFCNTIEEVQFPTVQLSDLLKEIREKYYHVLLLKWNDTIKQILSQDNYNCMELDNEEDYKRLMEAFPCRLDVSLNNSNAATTQPGGAFLVRLPYSACVPKIFVQIKEFVNNCVKFADGLNSSQTELDDMVRKPTNKLITDKLNENIRNLIKKVSLAQLVQIVINTIYLERSIELLEQHLLNVIE